MINIAEKLIHCKKGTKLYCTLYGEVILKCVDQTNTICFYATNKDGNIESRFLNSYGTLDGYTDCECLLFPSKEQRDWSIFSYLEEGHRVMVSDNGINWNLRKYYKDATTYCFDEDPNNHNSIWTYIVPVEDFDFTAEDITVNCAKSII